MEGGDAVAKAVASDGFEGSPNLTRDTRAMEPALRMQIGRVA
jgi:hypothetical protein